VTQVDFYILGSNSNDSRLRAACRITEKAVQQNHHVFVNSADDADALKLNGLLWTFSQGSFIPHVMVNDRLETPPTEPVLIGINPIETEDDVTNQLGENWDLMINLAQNIPGFFSRYARVAEVIDSDPIRREKGREHYRFYRDRGYELKIHNI